MVVHLDDHEVVVGQCHPGQARILRKNGMAEWEKDKLVLKQAIDYNSWIQALHKDGVAPEEIKHIVAREAGWGPYRPETFVKEVLFSNTVSPEQWAEAGDLQDSLRLMKETEERDSEDLKSWLTELKNRKAQGHTIYTCEDPRALKLGFMDHDEGIWFKISLRKIKMATDEDFQELGIDRSVLASSQGREELIGGWDFLKMPDVGNVEIPEGVTLERIWAEEARVDVEEASMNMEELFFIGGDLVTRDESGLSEEELRALGTHPSSGPEEG